MQQWVKQTQISAFTEFTVLWKIFPYTICLEKSSHRNILSVTNSMKTSLLILFMSLCMKNTTAGIWFHIWIGKASLSDWKRHGCFSRVPRVESPSPRLLSQVSFQWGHLLFTELQVRVPWNTMKTGSLCTTSWQRFFSLDAAVFCNTPRLDSAPFSKPPPGKATASGNKRACGAHAHDPDTGWGRSSNSNPPLGQGSRWK